MRENEAAAHALVLLLKEAGIEAKVSGGGVHWQVDVTLVASRGLRAHCFWYERAISGLLLGMNPRNGRSRLRSALPPPYEGPEYLVNLYEGEDEVAQGRTRHEADVVACAQAWLARASLDQLAREVSFIDEKPRAMRALAAQLDPSLRHEIGSDPGGELWVYGGDRSCEIVQGRGGVSSSFLLGQAQVAYAAALEDIPKAVSAWLVSRLPMRALATRMPGVEIERHAEILETDPARWHWLHVRDRIADPNDVLAPLGQLIEILAASHVATKFFPYSSLNRFCFSASSHYPWVDGGLPIVAPAGKRQYFVDDARCELGDAVKRIEATLAASPLQPFFGSEVDHELPLFAACFSRQGSALRPQLVQQGRWYRLVVADSAGARRCVVSVQSVSFEEGPRRLDIGWPNLDDTVRGIRRYCEEGASLEDLAADRSSPGLFEARPSIVSVVAGLHGAGASEASS